MTRRLAKALWAIVFLAVFIAVGSLVDIILWPGHHVGGGIAGLGGALTLYWLRAFDRRWPKPKPGWAE